MLALEILIWIITAASGFWALVHSKKLESRFALVISILIMVVYYLYPTFIFGYLNNREKEIALEIADKMEVSYAYVIENLYKDEAFLRDKLEENDNMSREEKSEVVDLLGKAQGDMRDDLLKYRKRAIKRGLDLQGGMHLVLEVDHIQLMRNIARQRDQRLDDILDQIDSEMSANPLVDFNDVVTKHFRESDLKLSQYFGEPGESDATILSIISDQVDDAINRSLEILGNRIDQFGVSEPSIRKQGQRRIVLELPGIQDPARARDLIGRTAQLEFKLVADPEKVHQFLKDVDAFLSSRKQSFDDTLTIPAGDEFEVLDQTAEITAQDTAISEPEQDDILDLTAELADDTAAAVSDTGFIESELIFSSLLRGFRGDIAVPAENMRKIRTILSDPDVKKLLPDGTQFIWAAKPEYGGEGEEYNVLFLVKTNPEITGSSLTDARVELSSGTSDIGRAGQPIVSLAMDRAGARKFARVTGANIDKRLAIVLDEKVYMAPVIRVKIPNGRAIIEGSDDIDEAEDLAIVLRAGALPTSVIIEEERTVGPSLGRDSIRKGTTSAIVGMILVVIFMVIYYGASGLVANVALLLNILLIFGGLAFFGAMGTGATLSLPGIAGIILTIGMAVDANVLIFERIREELETGKTVWHAISAGYDRAFRTILDANLTTLIAALVLLQFGSGPIKGFAITLAIGIVASLFTSIVVTRLIFDYITSRRTLTRLSI
ncbi:protein translocase subunit SecD [bacterium]|nr:protein translocase subunit SecD [bacterium]